MRNITVFSVLVIISTVPTFGQHSKYLPPEEAAGKNYSFSINPQIGFVYGQALEFAYQSPGYNDSEFLSKLNWDMKPVFYAGLQIDFGRTDITSGTGFFSSVSFKMGIPGDTGFMEDRDWGSNKHSNLTDFSRHTNRTQKFYWFDAAIGISIADISFFYMIPFINGSWMHFAFIGRDGYGEYPEMTDPNMRYIDYIGQNVITYKQDWFLLAAGFTIGTKVLYPFTIDLSFRISNITYCAALDEHLGGVLYPNGKYSVKQTFQDYTRFGLYFEPGCTVSYKWKKKIDFSLDINYRHIGKTRGILYYNNVLNRKNDSGAGLSLLDTRFLIKYRLASA